MFILKNDKCIYGIYKDLERVWGFLKRRKPLVYTDTIQIVPLEWDQEYPFYISEPQMGVFEYHKTKEEALENVNEGTVYTITKDWSAEVVGKDEMGRLDHEHYEGEEE